MNQAELHEKVCDDLKPVLDVLLQRYGLHGWKHLLAPDSGRSVLFLQKNLSPEIVATLQDQFANSPQLGFGADRIQCSHHDSWIYSAKLLAGYRRWLSPRRKDWFGPWTQLFSALFLIAGGVLKLMDGMSTGHWTDIIIGALGILLFGLSGTQAIRELWGKRTKKPKSNFEN